MVVVTGKNGNYRQDAMGVWHYKPTTQTDLRHMVESALAGDIPIGPKFFWYNNGKYFCPIMPNDHPKDLLDRACVWHMGDASRNIEFFFQCSEEK